MLTIGYAVLHPDVPGVPVFDTQGAADDHAADIGGIVCPVLDTGETTE